MKHCRIFASRTVVRIFSALLCAAALIPATLGCGESGTAAATTAADSSAAAAEAETTAVPLNADTAASIYGDVDYGGYGFRVCAISPGKHFYRLTSAEENELYYETSTGDVLKDAIYDRMVKLEDALNVKLTPVFDGDTGDISNVVKKSVMAGDDFADAVLNRLDYQMNSAAAGQLVNVMSIDTVDPKQVWWDKDITAGFTMFGDHLYVLAGDINYYDDYGVMALYANKRLITNLGYQPLYDKVRDGTWTFDVFCEMTKAAVSDLNGDGTITLADDQLGFSNHGDAILHFIYPFNEKMTVTDASGNVAVNYPNEHLTTVVGELYDFFNSANVIIDGVNYAYVGTFKDGRMLFYADMVGSMSSMREMTDDFEVLPLFKEDEKQEQYRAYVSNGWSTAYSIPLTCPDVSRSGVVLSTMSAISRDTVTPALYDVMLAEKFVRDEDSKEMLSYVWASKDYDIAGDLAWAAGLRGVYQSLTSAKSNTYVSAMEKKLPSIQKTLDKFLASFQG